jgi:hypothetical protein
MILPASSDEVRRVRFDDGCYKVYTTEKTTVARWKPINNPANGKLVRARLGR